jgi:ribosome-associated toxin RatA of RatAB toxin-antitoxin module
MRREHMTIDNKTEIIMMEICHLLFEQLNNPPKFDEVEKSLDSIERLIKYQLSE